MLTAKDDEFDRVLGLELGADDYMTKPFSPREVVARVKAILRRSAIVNEAVPVENDEDDILIGSIRIRPEYFEVYREDELLELTPKEFELLLYLIERQGRVITREHMLNSVWNYEFAGDSRIVDVHISHLRDKLEENPKQPKLIKTVRGLGYKLRDLKSNVKVSTTTFIFIMYHRYYKFLALGAIITHAIYNTVSSAQEGDLEHQADHLVKLYKNDKENEMTDIAKSEKLTVKIEESNDVLFSTNQGTQINEDIKMKQILLD